VLGLGAGIVPMRFAGRGVSVEAVEIDPVSLRAAKQFFGFDGSRVQVRQTDARAYVRSCTPRFDVVVVDLFHGDGTPDYLVTREFFHDLGNCLVPGGVAVFNTFADLEYPAAYAHFLTTLKAELPYVTLYRPDWGHAVRLNSFVVAGAAPLPSPVHVTLDDVPSIHGDTLWTMLAHPRPVDAGMTKGGRVVSDAVNAGALDFALTQLGYRRAVVESLPARLLLN
jgi:hypothetical protein